jgi:hypothetical protein
MKGEGHQDGPEAGYCRQDCGFQDGSAAQVAFRARDLDGQVGILGGQRGQ